MKNSNQILWTLAATLGITMAGHATIIVNDTWADGSRAEQNLPTESRWFAANRASNFVTTAGSMTFTPESGTSRAGLTYFTAHGSPVTLADGQMLKVTAVYKPTGVSANNSTSRSMRFGVIDSSAGTRLSADATSSNMNGANVTGYGLFLNHFATFGAPPMDILERTTASNADLLGSTGAWTSFGSGGGAATDPGFASGTEYTMVFSLARNGSSLDITTAFSGGSMNISHTVTDTTPTFSFDGFAFRTTDRENTASSFQFTQFKVEVVPVPEPSSLALGGLGLLGLLAVRYRAQR